MFEQSFIYFMHIWRDLSTCHPGTLFRKQLEEHKDLEYRQKAKNKINSNQRHAESGIPQPVQYN